MSQQNGITYVSQPRTTTYNSQNAVIDLHHETGEYANVKIIINYPNPNATIQEYKSGNLINQYIITNPYEIDYIITDLDKIVITDSNSYNIIVTVQFIKGDPFVLQLYRDIKFISISNVPNANIVSPVDANGNVKVDLETPAPFRNAVNVSSFTQTLTTANTKQALNNVVAYNFVSIINLSPSDNVYIGDINNQIIPLAPNGVYNIDLHEAPLNLSSIYWLGATAGDKIGVLYA